MIRARLDVGLLTVVGALLRFPTLDAKSFWEDEAITVFLVRRGFGSMLSAIPDSESTPPVYYVLAWVWTHVFGSGEVGIRSLSALIGTATVPVAYLAGRERDGRGGCPPDEARAARVAQSAREAEEGQAPGKDEQGVRAAMAQRGLPPVWDGVTRPQDMVLQPPDVMV